MEFKSYLEKSAKEIDREVKKILDEQIKVAEKTDKQSLRSNDLKKLVPLLKAFAKTCHGGKRIRGCLVILGYLLGKKFSIFNFQFSNQEILRVAAAYEICHSAILAHDDIIDESAMRRDQPSLYQVLGTSQAITLADYGFFLAFKIIAETPAAGLFSKIMIDTAFGQMLELKKANPILVMKLKTACYTIAGPLQIGAVLAEADAKLIKALGVFGENLGIAYQIRDDILDGDAGVLEEAEKYTKKAMNILPEITKDKRMSKILHQMAEYLVRRTK